MKKIKVRSILSLKSDQYNYFFEGGKGDDAEEPDRDPLEAEKGGTDFEQDPLGSLALEEDSSVNQRVVAEDSESEDDQISISEDFSIKVEQESTTDEVSQGSPCSELNTDFVSKTIPIAAESLLVDDSLINDTNENGGVELSVSKVRASGRRVYDKVHVCVFCEKKDGKMCRHLQRHHSNEGRVRVLMDLPINSKERSDGFAALLREGDYLHNCRILETNQGELILARRPGKLESKLLKPSDFAPCPFCLGFLLRAYMCKHKKICTFRQGRSNNSSTIEIGSVYSMSSSSVQENDSAMTCGRTHGDEDSTENRIKTDDATPSENRTSELCADDSNAIPAKITKSSTNKKGSRADVEVINCTSNSSESIISCSDPLNAEKSSAETRVISGKSLEEEKSSVALTVSKFNGNRRIYDKTHCCLFCQKRIFKILRHIQACHRKEERVKKIFDSTKDSEVLDGFALLIKEGDYRHNCKVLKSGCGELILARRPGKFEVRALSPSDFIPCPFCLSFIKKTTLWKHKKTCSNRLGSPLVDEALDEAEDAGSFGCQCYRPPTRSENENEIHQSLGSGVETDDKGSMQNLALETSTDDSIAVPAKERESSEAVGSVEKSLEEEKSGVALTVTKKNKGNRRIYDKTHCCLFCQKRLFNIFRHIQGCHAKEEKVKELLTKESEELLAGFSLLIKEGDYRHNCKVLKSGCGDLILARRPGAHEVNTLSPSDFHPCPFCLSFIKKTTLWKHKKTCSNRLGTPLVDQTLDETEDAAFFGGCQCYRTPTRSENENKIEKKEDDHMDALDCSSPLEIEDNNDFLDDEHSTHSSNVLEDEHSTHSLDFSMLETSLVTCEEPSLPDNFSSKTFDEAAARSLNGCKECYVVLKDCSPLGNNFSNQSCTVQSYKSTISEINAAENYTSHHNTPTSEDNVTEGVKLAVSCTPRKGKRIYDSFHYCLFCQKKVYQVSKHLRKAHRNEERVKVLLKLPKFSKERAHGFGVLTREGDYQHNCEVLDTNSGQLILARRPNKHTAKFLKPSDFVPCPYCLGFFVERRLEKHMKFCIAQKDNFEDSLAVSSGEKAALALEEYSSRGIPQLIEEIKSNLTPSNTEEVSEECLVESHYNFRTPAKGIKSKSKDIWSNIQLQTTRKREETGKLVFDKKHSCLFCQKKYTKISRHLKIFHSSEEKVESILSLPKGSKERNEKFSRLLKEGDFYHNCRVLEAKSGELFLTRRPGKADATFLKPSDYVPCSLCLSFVTKKNFYKHKKHCRYWIKEAEKASQVEKKIGIGLTRSNKNEENGKRIYDKFHCCLFCRKKFYNITRHIVLCHRNEERVKHLLSFPEKSKERIDCYLLLSREGDFYYNCEALRSNCGDLILARRPGKNEAGDLKPKDFVPCPKCLGFMSKKNLTNHKKHCHLVNSNVDIKKLEQEILQLLAERSVVANDAACQGNGNLEVHKKQDDSAVLKDDFDGEGNNVQQKPSSGVILESDHEDDYSAPSPFGGSMNGDNSSCDGNSSYTEGYDERGGQMSLTDFLCKFATEIEDLSDEESAAQTALQSRTETSAEIVDPVVEGSDDTSRKNEQTLLQNFARKDAGNNSNPQLDSESTIPSATNAVDIHTAPVGITTHHTSSFSTPGTRPNLNENEMFHTPHLNSFHSINAEQSLPGSQRPSTPLFDLMDARARPNFYGNEMVRELHSTNFLSTEARASLYGNEMSHAPLYGGFHSTETQSGLSGNEIFRAPLPNSFHAMEIRPTLYGNEMSHASHSNSFHTMEVRPSSYGNEIPRPPHPNGSHSMEVRPNLYGNELSHAPRPNGFHSMEVRPSLYRNEMPRPPHPNGFHSMEVRPSLYGNEMALTPHPVRFHSMEPSPNLYGNEIFEAPNSSNFQSLENRSSFYDNGIFRSSVMDSNGSLPQSVESNHPSIPRETNSIVNLNDVQTPSKEAEQNISSLIQSNEAEQNGFRIHSMEAEKSEVSQVLSKVADHNCVKLCDCVKKVEQVGISKAAEVEEDEDEVEISVAHKNEKTGARLYDKKQSCLYCQKKALKLLQHFKYYHKTEERVKSILSLPKGSKERNDRFALLVREGNFQHNCRVIESGRGSLILKRRPGKLEAKLLKPTDFTPCSNCLSFILRKNLYRHRKICLKLVKLNWETEVSTATQIAIFNSSNANAQENHMIGHRNHRINDKGNRGSLSDYMAGFAEGLKNKPAEDSGGDVGTDEKGSMQSLALETCADDSSAVPAKKTETKEAVESAETSQEEEKSRVALTETKKTAENNRIYDKTHCCLYCQKRFFNIFRHIQGCHAKEEKVKELLTKDSEELLAGFSLLIKEGDYRHNCKVLKSGCGDLILARRPGKLAVKALGPSDFRPCPFCLSFIMKAHMWKHKKICPNRSGPRLIDEITIDQTKDIDTFEGCECGRPKIETSKPKVGRPKKVKHEDDDDEKAGQTVKRRKTSKGGRKKTKRKERKQCISEDEDDNQDEDKNQDEGRNQDKDDSQNEETSQNFQSRRASDTTDLEAKPTSSLRQLRKRKTKISYIEDEDEACPSETILAAKSKKSKTDGDAPYVPEQNEMESDDDELATSQLEQNETATNDVESSVAESEQNGKQTNGVESSVAESEQNGKQTNGVESSVAESEQNGKQTNGVESSIAESEQNGKQTNGVESSVSQPETDKMGDDGRKSSLAQTEQNETEDNSEALLTTVPKQNVLEDSIVHLSTNLPEPNEIGSTELTSAQTDGSGKLKYDKMHSCLFCQKKTSTIVRHLRLCHEQEGRVKSVLSLPIHSKERMLGYALLVRAGDYVHNCQVLKANSGELILARRSEKLEPMVLDPSDYRSCSSCLGLVTKRSFFKHRKHCVRQVGNFTKHTGAGTTQIQNPSGNKENYSTNELNDNDYPSEDDLTAFTSKFLEQLAAPSSCENSATQLPSSPAYDDPTMEADNSMGTSNCSEDAEALFQELQNLDTTNTSYLSSHFQPNSTMIPNSFLEPTVLTDLSTGLPIQQTPGASTFGKVSDLRYSTCSSNLTHGIQPGSSKIDSHRNNKTKKKKQGSEIPAVRPKSPSNDSDDGIDLSITFKDEASGKKINNKVHCCIYCDKLDQKLARHFERKHSSEERVKALLSLPKLSKERSDGFALLTREGDYYYNCRVLESNSGELILARRPGELEAKFLEPKDYAPCSNCLAFILVKNFKLHLKRCPNKLNPLKAEPMIMKNLV